MAPNRIAYGLWAPVRPTISPLSLYCCSCHWILQAGLPSSGFYFLPWEWGTTAGGVPMLYMTKAGAGCLHCRWAACGAGREGGCCWCSGGELGCPHSQGRGEGSLARGALGCPCGRREPKVGWPRVASGPWHCGWHSVWPLAAQKLDSHA